MPLFSHNGRGQSASDPDWPGRYQSTPGVSGTAGSRESRLAQQQYRPWALPVSSVNRIKGPEVYRVDIIPTNGSLTLPPDSYRMQRRFVAFSTQQRPPAHEARAGFPN